MSVCARAARMRKQIVVPDIEADPGYAPIRDIAREAGYRAVQSTPLIAAAGELIGVVSAYFRERHAPAPIEMRTLEEYCAHAADHLRSLLCAAGVHARADEMSRRARAGL